MLIVFTSLFVLSACDFGNILSDNDKDGKENNGDGHTTHILDDWCENSATCTEDGTEKSYCQEDGCSYCKERKTTATGHNYVNDVCTACGEEIVYSSGLSFTYLKNGTCEVAGMGSCEDKTVIIPPTAPDGCPVTGIGEKAFYYSNVEVVKIPEGITYIGSYAFRYCRSLTCINIPSSVVNIGVYAFESCNKLTSLYLTDISRWCSMFCGDTLGLFGDSSLTYETNLYLNGELVTELVIPDGVTMIRDGAFRGFTNITSVAIPEGVTSIGRDAFLSCDDLKKLEIPSSVTSIENRSFEEIFKIHFYTLSEHSFIRFLVLCIGIERIIYKPCHMTGSQ